MPTRLKQYINYSTNPSLFPSNSESQYMESNSVRQSHDLIGLYGGMHHT